MRRLPLAAIVWLIAARTSVNSDSNQTVFATDTTSTFPESASESCQEAKTACENDTDCYHRLFYSHTTCVSGVCKPQCKTAVLRLYETKLGRLVLHSDFSCLGNIVNSVVNCQLDPRSPVLHCTLSRLMCELDDECSKLFDQFETKCERKPKPAIGCEIECAKSLAAVFNHSIGRTLANCTCWSDDDDSCLYTKETTIDSCKADALLMLEAERRYQEIFPITAVSVSNLADQWKVGADFRNSNVFQATKKPNRNIFAKSRGSLSRHGWCWIGIALLLQAPLKLW